MKNGAEGRTTGRSSPLSIMAVRFHICLCCLALAWRHVGIWTDCAYMARCCHCAASDGDRLLLLGWAWHAGSVWLLLALRTTNTRAWRISTYLPEDEQCFWREHRTCFGKRLLLCARAYSLRARCALLCRRLTYYTHRAFADAP